MNVGILALTVLCRVASPSRRWPIPKSVMRHRCPCDLTLRQSVDRKQASGDINSRNNPNDPATNGELACLAAILNTTMMTSGFASASLAPSSSQSWLPLRLAMSTQRGHRSAARRARCAQQTLNLLSQTLPAQETDELQLDLTQTAALRGVSDEKFERTIVLCHTNSSKSADQVPRLPRCAHELLRMCLKSIWHFSKACDRVRHGLPAYFPVCLPTQRLSTTFGLNRILLRVS